MQPARERTTELGLSANWRQFWLLVLVNAFVGALVGLERTVLPLLAEDEFGLGSKRAVLSFIATFGLVKATSNLIAGRLSDVIGRKRVLVLGWLLGVPVPFLVMWAPSWSWIVLANALLGANQGLAWSTTVLMKIDLVGPKQRGLAMGLNEFAGYLAVALAALATGIIAERYGLRPEPFYVGIAVVAAGLALSILLVRETRPHALLEAAQTEPGRVEEQLGTAALFARASWQDRRLVSVNQAGLVNNLNDGLAWGLFPLFFAAGGMSVGEIGMLSFTYPAVWGVLQVWTGQLSDEWGRKWLIVSGMTLQAVALLAIALVHGFWPWAAAAVLLGAGTALVYPTLIAAVADVAHPSWRGAAVGIYRLWRDSGYVVGAVVAGVAADALGMSAAIGVVAGLTLLSGAVVAWQMTEST